MRAVTLRGFGAVDNLIVSSVPKPTLTSLSDVLIKVKSTAVNRGDIMQRKGHYPPPPGCTDILGLEAAGVVEAVGPGVTRFVPGDRVMALLSGGGYAEYAVASEGSVMAIPAPFSFTQAAAIPEAFLTAWQALAMTCRTREGDRVLVHAGASGVGTAAAQLVERVLKGQAITTSSESKVPFCRQYASYAVSRTPELGNAFSKKVFDALGDKRGVQTVIDPVFGGTYLEEDGECLGVDGTIVVIAFMGGHTITQWKAAPFFAKRANICFSTLRSRSDAYKAALVQSFEASALPCFERGCDGRLPLEPVISKVFPLDAVREAHRLVDSNESLGKIILEM